MTGLGAPTHVALVVRDMEASMVALQPFAGDWDVAPTHDVEVSAGPERYKVSLSRAFSASGPVLLELIQAVPGSVWQPRDEDYYHHIGYLLPKERFVETSRRLDSIGLHLEATRWHPSGAPHRWVYHRQAGGMRLELVQQSRQR
jgi:hypothetical protein